MKIMVTDKSYKEVISLPKEKHINPVKQRVFWRWLLKLLSVGELKAVDFSYTTQGIDTLDPNKPVLILMNHSSFTDLQIAATLLSKRQYHIIMTDDGMIGKSWLMRNIGCIPTKKFIQDTVLVKDMVYCVKKLNSSILMYPEASYSFDGTATPLPDSLGKLIKLLGIPVVMIKTKGAFLRDPLYNNLRKRNVKVTATETLLLTADEAESKSVAEINDVLKTAFTFDNFREQVEDGVLVSEDFRADDLERVLYKCPHCNNEGSMRVKGTSILCSACGESHTLLETGKLKCTTGDTLYEYISDWYSFERACVRTEIENNSYLLDIEVTILVLVDSKSMYRIGDGHLIHNTSGFTLTGSNGELSYHQGPRHSYSLYSDYYWYELGDMICIGDSDIRYYCFPRKEANIPVAKARLATEELWKINCNM